MPQAINNNTFFYKNQITFKQIGSISGNKLK